MATQVLIHTGQGGDGKVRNPWAVLGLTLITFGFYGWYWWYQINREMAELGRVKVDEDLGDSPGVSLLAYSLGSFILIPFIWTVITTAIRLKRAQRAVGISDGFNGWIYALLWIFTLGLGAIVYEQHHMNRWLKTQTVAPATDAVASETAPA